MELHLHQYNTIAKPSDFQLVTSTGMCYAHNRRIDFHSHFPSPDSLVCTAEPEAPMPRQQEMQAAEKTALMHFQGLLPDRYTAAKQARLFSNLTASKHIHLGEVGLDKRFSDLLPMQKQADILRSGLEFAVRNTKAVSLHCVRATGLMLEILEELTFRPFSVIWHGYSGSPETARQLAKMNIILSIGPRFKGSLSDIFKANPVIVPETDYEGTDAQEHGKLLESQYRRFETELNLSADEVEMHCMNVFGKLTPAH